MNGDGIADTRKSLTNFLCQSRHNFLTTWRTIWRAAASTSGFIRCWCAKRRVAGFPKAAYVPARRICHHIFNAVAQYGIAFQPLNTCCGNSVWILLIHSGVVRFGHLIHQSVHHAGAVQDRAHTPLQRVIYLPGVVIQPTKRRFAASPRINRQRCSSRVVRRSSVQTWKTPQCCSDASACCSSVDDVQWLAVDNATAFAVPKRKLRQLIMLKHLMRQRSAFSCGSQAIAARKSGRALIKSASLVDLNDC